MQLLVRPLKGVFLQNPLLVFRAPLGVDTNLIWEHPVHWLKECFTVVFLQIRIVFP